jgi:hypothetical protein
VFFLVFSSFEVWKGSDLEIFFLVLVHGNFFVGAFEKREKKGFCRGLACGGLWVAVRFPWVRPSKEKGHGKA